MEKAYFLAPDLAVRLTSEDERFTLNKIAEDGGLILAEVSADSGPFAAVSTAVPWDSAL